MASAATINSAAMTMPAMAPGCILLPLVVAPIADPELPAALVGSSPAEFVFEPEFEPEFESLDVL